MHEGPWLFSDSDGLQKQKKILSCSFVQEVIWLFILILVEHANKDDNMGPKKQGIQEKMKINGTSREVVMMTNLRFKND